jgi:DNA-binding CsgD family transcriptional regulator
VVAAIIAGCFGVVTLSGTVHASDQRKHAHWRPFWTGIGHGADSRRSGHVLADRRSSFTSRGAAELAHGLADLGAELSRCGRRADGRDAQRRAISLAGQCGAVALAENAMAGLHAGPGRRARIELTGPDALTAAERRVCRQVAGGQTNREVAQALFVTEKTVERHLSSAYQKLGIRSRFQLASAIGG